jgi:hypothetical protein
METQPKFDIRRSSSVPNETHNRKLLYNHNNNSVQRTTVTNTEDSTSSSKRGSINTRPLSSCSSKTQNETTVINQFPMPPSSTEANRNQLNTRIPTKQLTHSDSPTSSSESSATIGHGVTHGSQVSDVNNNDHIKPAENNASELPVVFPVIDEKKMELSDLLQAQIQKMALNEDLVLLQRTVDRMQQQRATDLEEHLTRVKEQKKTEKEILEQINLTKQRLELAIAGKLFTCNQQQSQGSSSSAAADPQPKPSNSTNTARHSKFKIPKDDAYQPQQEENYYQRQRNQRSNRYDNENGTYFPDLGSGRANFEFMANQHYPYHPHYEYPYDGNMMYGGFIDSPPKMRMNPSRRYHPPPLQQEYASARPRSKSMESQWFNPNYMDPQDQKQEQRFYQQYMHNNQPEMISDLDNHQFTPTNRSRKSSLLSLRSDISESNNEKVVGVDLKDEPVNLTKEDPAVASSSEEYNEKRRQHRRHNSGGGHFRSTITKSSKTRRPNAPPPMMYPAGAFVGGPPPPPHLFDRERIKMRPPPPPSFGYSNMPPPPPPLGNEYFSHMPPPQHMSPRFMAAFAADDQQQQHQQPSWSMGIGQWGPPQPQNMYGMPPPPRPDNTINPGGGGASNGLPDQQPPSQDQPPFNSSGGSRRFNSAAAAGVVGQQPPHSSMHHPQYTTQQHGYLSMYSDRIYL